MYCKNFLYCIYISFSIHFGFVLFFWLTSLLNFSSSPMNMHISEKPVIVRIGQIRNTRMKELDALSKISNDDSSEKNSNENRLLEKREVKDSEEKIEKVTNDKKESNLIKNNNQKNFLEIKKKVNKVNKVTNRHDKKNSKKSNSKHLTSTKVSSKKYTMFDGIEDISDNCASISDCKTISDVHKLQFKHDVIEFIKANWNIPDCLIGKNIKISVIIVFDRNGYITNYEIKEYCRNGDYEILVESIKELFFIIRKKRLPINGRKLSFNSIIFTFSPVYN